jgi:hypothetical protein
MPDATPGHLAEGSVLADRYEIIERLGAGGMGAVYLARHLLMERLCAIKVLHPALARDPEALQRFTSEARNASRIHHPNVCTVYDFGATPDGTVYLAMEYVDGRSLGTILAEQGALPVQRAAALLDGIAAGLDAAHALGIVHRDLKPDNVMVVAQGGRESVKLVDFGIAKALERDVARDVTAPGTVVGTPDYMSPEQFAGDPADRRSDVYALGLITYRMVTGILPFRADTARETLVRRLTEPPEPLAAAAPGIAFPAGFQQAVDRALARRPDDRFSAAGELAGAVRATLAGLPANTADVTPTVRMDAATQTLAGADPSARGRARRTLPWLVPAGAVVLAAGVVAVVLSRTPEAAGGAQTSVSAPVLDTMTLAAGDTGTRATERSEPEPMSRPLTQAATDPARPAGPPPPAATVPRDDSPAREPHEAAPTAVPALPSDDEVADPATRDGARARAEAIYRRTDVDAATRAIAAYTVSSAWFLDRQIHLADVWADRALTANREAPAGADRDRREGTYRAWLDLIRRRDTTPP